MTKFKTVTFADGGLLDFRSRACIDLIITKIYLTVLYQNNVLKKLGLDCENYNS